MSSDSETAEDTEKTKDPLAAVSDGACTVEFTQIVPQFDRASDDYNTQDFIPSSFEVKLEDLVDVKQEAADETDDYQAHLVVHVQPDNILDVKLEPADESDNEDANYPIKQELADDYETEHPCFTMQVSSADFSHRNLVLLPFVLQLKNQVTKR